MAERKGQAMKYLLLALVVLFAGCQSTPPKIVLQEVKVPLPVECKEPVPARPAMPTESLKSGSTTVSEFVKAAQAEILRREGYEVQLLTALENCRKPIDRPAQELR